MFIDYRRARTAASAGSVWEKIWQLTESPLRVGLVRSFKQDFLCDDTLRLKADQPIPGEAWLEWKVNEHEDGALLEQTIFFAPKGLPGFLDWYLLRPFYRWEFEKLLRRLTVDR
jgi:hypothetical protein